MSGANLVDALSTQSHLTLCVCLYACASAAVALPSWFHISLTRFQKRMVALLLCITCVQWQQRESPRVKTSVILAVLVLVMFVMLVLVLLLNLSSIGSSP